MTYQVLARLLALRDKPFTRWGEFTGREQGLYMREARRLMAYGSQYDEYIRALHEEQKTVQRKRIEDALR